MAWASPWSSGLGINKLVGSVIESAAVARRELEASIDKAMGVEEGEEGGDGVDEGDAYNALSPAALRVDDEGSQASPSVRAASETSPLAARPAAPSRPPTASPRGDPHTRPTDASRPKEASTPGPATPDLRAAVSAPAPATPAYVSPFLRAALTAAVAPTPAAASPSSQAGESASPGRSLGDARDGEFGSSAHAAESALASGSHSPQHSIGAADDDSRASATACLPAEAPELGSGAAEVSDTAAPLEAAGVEADVGETDGWAIIADAADDRTDGIASNAASTADAAVESAPDASTAPAVTGDDSVTFAATAATFSVPEYVEPVAHDEATAALSSERLEPGQALPGDATASAPVENDAPVAVSDAGLASTVSAPVEGAAPVSTAASGADLAALQALLASREAAWAAAATESSRALAESRAEAAALRSELASREEQLVTMSSQAARAMDEAAGLREALHAAEAAAAEERKRAKTSKSDAGGAGEGGREEEGCVYPPQLSLSLPLPQPS